MKNMKMKTKLILGFMVPIMITVINILISDLTTKWVASISDPAEQQIFTRIATIFHSDICGYLRGHYGLYCAGAD